MAPTRELASQIYEVISRIAKFHSTLHATLMVGGTHVNECCTQYEEKGGHILIGTPGRILDVKNRIPTTLTFKKLEVCINNINIHGTFKLLTLIDYLLVINPGSSSR